MNLARGIEQDHEPPHAGFRGHTWRYSYRTSSLRPGEEVVDILHDFYIPALKLASRYDRVAGYFRSTSLAAASQGFTSFVGRKGKMRLIVGADLDPGDVRAILSGDQQRLASELNGRFEDSETWPESVKRGVTLLAWMVAQGHLDVRVALRVHAQTREPIPFESNEDGYFHEKWFVMRDAAGNRMYGTGSLNESKTALLHNFENLTMFYDWMGARDRDEIDQAERDFETLWAGDAPHLAVKRLPVAVKERLIRLADEVDRPIEIDGTPAVAAAEPDPTPSALERLRFAVLRDAPKMPGGRFVGLTTAPVEAWPHQEVVVRRLVATWPYSYLLCDEVGLGKTIEAGLAFRCLYLSGIVKRILIAAPAGLTEQWLRQMASKVLLPFGKVSTFPEIRHEYCFPHDRIAPAQSLFAPDLVIVSTGLLARRQRAQELRGAMQFDIVLVDEAHAARRRNPTEGTAASPDFGQLYQAVREFVRPSARSLWLATATPMQLHPVEVCDLIALTNRVGAFQESPRLTLEYYGILGALVRSERTTQPAWDFLRRVVQSVAHEDPFLWHYLQGGVIPSSYSRVLDQWLAHKRIPRGRDLDILRRLLFSVAPLSRVMMRHTRQLLEIYREKGQLTHNLARRRVLPLKGIQFTERERQIYDQLDAYCQGLAEQVQRTSNVRSYNTMQFFLSFLRLRFASSLYAIQQTLQRRLARVVATLAHQSQTLTATEDPDPTLDEWLDDDDEKDVDPDILLKDRGRRDLQWEEDRLRAMLSRLERLTETPSKMKELLRVLDERKRGGRIEQTVLFTRFYDTLTDVVRRLRTADPMMRIGTYSGRGADYYDARIGAMRAVDREEVKALFLRGEIDVLVCTDAAAEGLNLQTADLLINFDLGWNPMKIEQRIGRIDRIGQRHDEIYVLNLCYAGSAEETVYGRLLERLESVNLVVGTQQVSLLPVTAEDFQRLADGTLSEEALAEQAMARLKEQRERTESMELPARDLYEIYTRKAATRERGRAPVDRRSVWAVLSESEFLRQLGCEVAQESGRRGLVVRGVPGVPDGTRFTVSPEEYERGAVGEEGRLHFASYGDPYFDTLMDHLAQHDLPDCIKRIAVTVGTGNELEMVAFAVACRTAAGSVEVRMVRGWQDLSNMVIAEDVTLGDEQLEPLRQQLRQIAREELSPHQVVDAIEEQNMRSAKLERLLELAVIKDLLEVRGSMAGERASVNAVLRDIEELFRARSAVRVDVPAEPFQGRDLLFDVPTSTVRDRVNVLVPGVLAQASIDAARALVHSMKAQRNSVSVRTLLGRLGREMSGLASSRRGA